jgi:phage FluMu protein Com
MHSGKGFACPSCENDMRMFGFRCPNCNLYLVNKVLGTSRLGLECPRCKASITALIKEYSGNNKKKGIVVKAIDRFNVTINCERCASQVSVRVIEPLPWVRLETREEIEAEEKKENISSVI